MQIILSRNNCQICNIDSEQQEHLMKSPKAFRYKYNFKRHNNLKKVKFKFFRSFVSRNLKGRPYIIRAPDLRGQAQKRGEWDELLSLAQELAQDT